MSTETSYLDGNQENSKLEIFKEIKKLIYKINTLKDKKKCGEVLTGPGHGSQKGSCRRSQRGTFFIIYLNLLKETKMQNYPLPDSTYI
jgi:hypothetical protein